MKRNLFLSALAAAQIAVLTAAVLFHLFADQRSVAFTLGIAVCALALGSFAGWLTQSFLLKPFDHFLQSARELMQGGAGSSRRLRVPDDPDLGELAQSINGFIDRSHSWMNDLQTNVNSLHQAAREWSQGSHGMSNDAEGQHLEISQVATAVSQMSTTVQDVANNVATAAHDAGAADAEANQGKLVVAQTMQSIRALADDIERAAQVIGHLQKESENIGSVLDVIRGIAEQTNLLALNAAIEAARAGEQGRGFAVVADEVRTLASRTQSSTEEIQAMIQRLQNGARDAVNVMEQGRRQAEDSVVQAEKAGSSLDEITRAVGVIKDMTSQIAVASRDQSQVTTEINRSLNNISTVANGTAEGIRRNLHHTQNVMQLAKSLEDMVTRFT